MKCLSDWVFDFHCALFQVIDIKNSFLISVSSSVLISSLRLFDVAAGRKSIFEGLNHK
jgi:hypothetical protein